ncbi:MBL fold metallo-hydrolase [bacterium]|nr:MBL fold metallo-hydrolase [bacterium]
MTATLLGCGSSSGVPLIGCHCVACSSPNPKNNRSRASLLVDARSTGANKATRLLIDTSPDLRQQALKHNITTVDGILFTHDHADHTHGIDDVRSFNYHRSGIVPAWADAVTIATLRERFGYVFRPPKPEFGWYAPALDFRQIPDPLTPFEAAGIPVIPFWQDHGRVRSLGFRIGNLAYSTDAKALDETAFGILQGVDTWIVDCLKETPTWSHSHLEQTLEWIERVKPRRAILTHMSHELEYEALSTKLPPGTEPSYDGMVITL